MPHKKPFTEHEQEIQAHLIAAWNIFCKLEKTHPSEAVDFMNAIHAAQDILGSRVLRRDYPNDFATYEQIGDIWKIKQ